MKPCLLPCLFALTLATATSTALAEDSENRAIDAGVTHVELNGVASLQLRWGQTPALTVYAQAEDLKKITTSRHGDTLEIDTGNFSMRASHMRVELTLPALRELNSSGTGSVQLSGFSGDELRLNSSGTGKIEASFHYKHLVARSSGVAGMNLDDGDSDSVELNLPGAGHVTLLGQTKNFTGKLDGVGSVDASGLKADTVNAYLNGVGSVKAYARQTANIHLRGVGSATIYGNPTNRNGEVSGFGKINWE
jgi:Putative auto-transporter adhesin, head GIN domain